MSDEKFEALSKDFEEIEEPDSWEKIGKDLANLTEDTTTLRSRARKLLRKELYNE